jgi:hypothetical protein
MAVTNWENLAKNGMNPQTIPAYVDEKIGEHNADATAHMASEASLAAHRASEVCDHLAESVVNDKLAPKARAFVAIVGSGNAGDFTTVQAGIASAVSAGGGTVLITPGTYYLVGKVQLPANVNLQGTDAEGVFIEANFGAGNYFELAVDADEIQVRSIIEAITFTNTGTGVFKADDEFAQNQPRFTFTDCRFKGGGEYIDATIHGVVFNDCLIEINQTVALRANSDFTLNNCKTTNKTGATSGRLVGGSLDHVDVYQVKINDGEFYLPAASPNYFIEITDLEECRLTNNKIINWDLVISGYPTFIIRDNDIVSRDGKNFDFDTAAGGYEITNNRLSSTEDVTLECGFSNSKVIGNTVDGKIKDVGEYNYIAGNYGDWDSVSTAMINSRTGGQSLSAATFTRVDFNQIDYSGGNADASKKYRYTAPCRGLYDVATTVAFSAEPDRVTIALYKNGSSAMHLVDDDSGTSRGMSGSAMIELDTNDYLEIYAYCASTATIDGGSGTNVTTFAVSMRGRKANG